MRSNELEIGDKMCIAGLETEVTGFDEIHGIKMVKTEYGDFNVDLVEKAEEENHA